MIDPSETLRWVKDYCDRGWKIFPVHSVIAGVCSCPRKEGCGKTAGKHPRVKGWQKAATSDFEAAKNWWAEWPDANVGIATGQASGGLVIIDVDGREGLETLGQFVDSHGPLPEGPIQFTGSGGLHLAFHAAGNYQNAVKVAPGIDVRADGGLIVAGPSVHLCGGRYTWQRFEQALPELPPWALGLVKGEGVSFDFAAWIAKQAPAVAGQSGHNAAFKVAMTAVQYGRLRTFEAFAEAVKDWNARCEPPWSEEELRHKHEDAMAKVVESGVVQVPFRNGRPFCSREALHKILREDPTYEHSFQFNELSMEVTFNGGPLKDSTITSIEVEICKRYGFDRIPRSELKHSIGEIAERRSFNPLTTYLKSLTWDGVCRIDEVPEKALGISPSADGGIHKTYARKWFIGAVARAMQPGCKLDTAWILVGGQGRFKSTFFETLAGGPDYFKDTHMDLESKDAYQQIQTWIYEWSELESIFRVKDVSRVKGFLSSKADSFRPPYGEVTVTRPRRCVIVGTTNEPDILKDPTGSRRFWITSTGMIDIGWTSHNRNQLWAEAVVRWNAGIEARRRMSEGDHSDQIKRLAGENQWWLTPDEDSTREDASCGYDSGSEIYEETMAALRTLEGDASFKGSLTMREICHRIGLDPLRMNPKEKADIGRALRQSGYALRRQNNVRRWAKES